MPVLTEPSMGALTARPPTASRMCFAVMRSVPPAVSATSTVLASSSFPNPSGAAKQQVQGEGTASKLQICRHYSRLGKILL